MESGGFLMEYYLHTTSSYSVFREYKKYLKAPTFQKHSLFETILDKCITRFVSWLIYHVASIGSAGRSQLFYYTLLYEFFGLSRQGINMCYKFGFAVSTDMHDSYKKLHYDKCQQNLAAKMSLPHVIWLDNFSKFKAHSIPTIRKDIFASCLHTGMTINEYSLSPDEVQTVNVTMDVQYDEEKNIIPAMPDDLLVYRNSVSTSIQATYQMGQSYYSQSLVHKYSIKQYSAQNRYFTIS